MGLLIIFFTKSSILHTLRIFIGMKPRKRTEDKKVKISITLNPEINKRLELEMVNKSKLIERLLIEYYGNKGL